LERAFEKVILILIQRNTSTKLNFYRGVPLREITDIILTLFGRKFEKNDSLYNVILGQVFGGINEELPKKTPTFSEKENLNELIVDNYLNQNGLDVIIFFF